VAGQYQRYSTVVARGIVTDLSPPVVVDSPVVNESNALYFVTRVQGHRGVWRPYADGLIGLVDVCTPCADLTSDGTSPPIILSDTVPGFGFGGGVTRRLNEEEAFFFGFVSLDLRMRYMHAAPSPFLGNDLRVRRVSANVLQWFVGLVFM
jgi:hypothetical protein